MTALTRPGGPGEPTAAETSWRKISADTDSGVCSWPFIRNGNSLPISRLISCTPFSGSTAVACRASSPTTTVPSGSK